jgi:hypothetical protein
MLEIRVRSMRRLDGWKDDGSMAKNLTRGILGLVLTAAATWLTGYIIEKIFGPDPDEQTA